MADELLDLDVFLRPDIRVKVNGTTYRLPGDPESETLLRVGMLFEELSKVDEDSPPERTLELREELRESVLDLFRIRKPDVEWEALRLSDTQVVELLRGLWERYSAEGEPVRPTTPQRTKSSRPSARRSRPTRSRSSTSSPT